MPLPKGAMPRIYTHEEKVALVTKVDQLLRFGLNKATACEAAGTNAASYANWVRAGILPVRRAAPVLRSDEERYRLVAAVEARMREGVTADAACREFGIKRERFFTWRKQFAPPPPMRPVEIEGGSDVTALVPVPSTALTIAPAPRAEEAPAPPPVGLALVAPGGYRIEGLSVEIAAALLRALA